jgi:hypothetical protein
VTSADDRLSRDYRAAFLRYLPRREEAALARAYEIGRAAVNGGVSLLTLTQIHHQVLIEVLRDVPAAELEGTATAASQFLLEALATYDMTQRRLHDPG